MCGAVEGLSLKVADLKFGHYMRTRISAAETDFVVSTMPVLKHYQQSTRIAQPVLRVTKKWGVADI